MLPALYELDPYAVFYRIDLTITAISSNGINSGASTIIFQRNQLPTNGTCYVTPTTGISMTTNFTVQCLNWYDPDGYIVRYEFHATYLSNENINGLGISTTGNKTFTLQQGPDYDDNKMYMHAQIFDNDGGSTIYEIGSITVTANTPLLEATMTALLSADPANTVVSNLYGGNTLKTLEIVGAFASMINSKSYSDANTQSCNLNLIEIKKIIL
jgi:hypothetical protein